MDCHVLDLRGQREKIFSEADRGRCRWRPQPAVEVLVDEHRNRGLEIRFLRLRGGQGGRCWRASLRFDELRDLGAGWGWAGEIRDSDGRTISVWVPRPPRSIGEKDVAGRMDIGPPVDGGWSMCGRSELCLELPPLGPDRSWEIPVVVERGPKGLLVGDLTRLSRLEWPRLVKSDWFQASEPAQLWHSLIDGDLYDPRPSSGGWGRFRCQQCAYAWWTYLRIGATTEDSALLQALATEVAWAIRVQYDQPGGWTHGFWCAEPETHLRFFNDGINLLLDESLASDDRTWIAAAEQAADEVLGQYTDDLGDGSIWFLHDSTETDGSRGGRKMPCLGQSPGTTLCLNTHVQMLYVLAKLSRLQDDRTREETTNLLNRGMRSAERLLGLDPAPNVYRWFGSLGVAAVQSKGRAGLKARLIRNLSFRVLPTVYWWVRRRWPRFVYPNGFIERDMGLSMLADDYHVLNLKDLLLLYRLEPRPWMRSVIQRGLAFLDTLDASLALDRSPLFIEAADLAMLIGEGLDAGDSGFVSHVSRELGSRWGAGSLDRARWSIRI